MRCAEAKNATNVTAILFCLITVFVFAVALLVLRLYALNLESRVAAAAGKIEACKNQNTLLERRCADLLSPTNVYTFARDRLNMKSSDEAAVIHIDASAVAMAKGGVTPSEGGAMVALARFNPFVNKAHAKE